MLVKCLQSKPSIKDFFFLLFYLFLAVHGLCCYAQAFSTCSEQGLLFVTMRGLLFVAMHGHLIAVASQVKHRP